MPAVKDPPELVIKKAEHLLQENRGTLIGEHIAEFISEGKVTVRRG